MNLDIAKYIDHTLLNPTATSQDITQAALEAKEYGFYGLCVAPCHVRQAVRELSSSKVAVVATVGFPLGSNLTDVKIAEAQRAIFEGAEELDMVMNLGALKEGNLDFVIDEIKAIIRVAKEGPVKVIIECDLLTDDEKIIATEACMKADAFMVKTSTGFVKDGKGATVHDIELLKKTIGENKLAIKASGGIRDYELAKELLDAGATRLGTSHGVALVKGTKTVAVGSY
jgi:deoxyribose-phosphate aldolase